MLLIVSAKTALHLVDSTGSLSQNLLLWMMKGDGMGPYQDVKYISFWPCTVYFQVGFAE